MPRNTDDCIDDPQSSNTLKPQHPGVYFLQSTTTGQIKIGFSSRIRRRIRYIQVSHPDTLKFLGWIEGDVNLEKSLHEKFAACRQRGEWFIPNDEMQAILYSLDMT